MTDEYADLLEKAKKFLSFYDQYNSYDIYTDELIDADPLVLTNTANEPLAKYSGENKIIKPAKLKVNDSDTVCDEEWMKANSLDEMRTLIEDCKKCHLYKTRTKLVFGEGDPNAKLVVVGEAPGESEDLQGVPFVGRAGQLLTKILEAINFKREEIFICNILKSRPPANRNPVPAEIAACVPYLHKQLELIKPSFILALGTFAAQSLLDTKEPLGKLRGKFHEYRGIKMMVTYHPAALLRNPNWKKPAWEDVQLLRKEYDKVVK